MAATSSKREYTHQELRTDYVGLAGYYCPQKEVILDYHGKKLLYIVGYAAIESSCCGVNHWDYVLVPGYIADWHKGSNDIGLPLSAVEPVCDPEDQEKLRQQISASENTDRISFW